MKLAVAGRSNIAWFKLADVVSRGEKERALSIYRLFAYSFRDDALSAQVEGDILCMFNDERALESYRRAARLYMRANDLTHAIFLYELMCELSPQAYDLHNQLFYWSVESSDPTRMISSGVSLLMLLARRNAWAEIEEIIPTSIATAGALKATIVQNFIVQALAEGIDITEDYLEKLLMHSIAKHATKGAGAHADPQVSAFLSQLAGLDDNLHAIARARIADM
jgi:tetratricopeptide (TPR) repeat protein